MATYADLRDDLVAALQALSTRTRMVSDIRTDLERIGPGETRYQLEILPFQKTGADANVIRDNAQVIITTAHMLADRFDERAWTEGQMWTDLQVLTGPAWWRGLSSVYQIGDSIEIETDRTVNVVFYELTTRVELAA